MHDAACRVGVAARTGAGRRLEAVAAEQVADLGQAARVVRNLDEDLADQRPLRRIHALQNIELGALHIDLEQVHRPAGGQEGRQPLDRRGDLKAAVQPLGGAR
jgi:hypothetical protein